MSIRAVSHRNAVYRDRGTTLAAKGLIGAIRIYQVSFSQLFTGSCRFVPSCSVYAVEAVMRHGAVRGGWLAVQRLARCHPLCPAGLDQVPPPDRNSR